MGKKGRKTRWRALTITGEQSDSEESNTAGSHHHQAVKNQVYQQQQQQNKTYYSKFPYSSHSTPTRRYQQYDTKSTRSSSTASENKITFNEDEYTKITTPRQDVLFKKGYLNKPKTYQTQTSTGNSTTSTGNSTGNGTPDHQSADGTEGTDLEYESQFVYPNGFVDQNGIYYINSYEPYPLVVYNAPPYCYPEFTNVKTKRYSTGSLTESMSPTNEEATSQDLNGGGGETVPEYNAIYNVVYPGFYYNGVCANGGGGGNEGATYAQQEPRRLKKRRRRRPSKSRAATQHDDGSSTSEYTDECESSDDEDSGNNKNLPHRTVEVEKDGTKNANDAKTVEDVKGEEKINETVATDEGVHATSTKPNEDSKISINENAKNDEIDTTTVTHTKNGVEEERKKEERDNVNNEEQIVVEKENRASTKSGFIEGEELEEEGNIKNVVQENSGFEGECVIIKDAAQKRGSLEDNCDKTDDSKSSLVSHIPNGVQDNCDTTKSNITTTISTTTTTNLKADAQEFVPRAYIQPVEFINFAPNIVPIPFMPPPSFMPPPIPINFVPQDAKLVPNYFIPDATVAVPAATIDVVEDEPAEEQQNAEENYLTPERDARTLPTPNEPAPKASKPSQTDIDIEKIVLKLEEAAKEQQMNEKKWQQGRYQKARPPYERRRYQKSPTSTTKHYEIGATKSAERGATKFVESSTTKFVDSNTTTEFVGSNTTKFAHPNTTKFAHPGATKYAEPSATKFAENCATKSYGTVNTKRFETDVMKCATTGTTKYIDTGATKSTLTGATTRSTLTVVNKSTLTSATKSTLTSATTKSTLTSAATKSKITGAANRSFETAATKSTYETNARGSPRHATTATPVYAEMLKKTQACPRHERKPASKAYQIGNKDQIATTPEHNRTPSHGSPQNQPPKSQWISVSNRKKRKNNRAAAEESDEIVAAAEVAESDLGNSNNIEGEFESYDVSMLVDVVPPSQLKTEAVTEKGAGELNRKGTRRVVVDVPPSQLKTKEALENIAGELGCQVKHVETREGHKKIEETKMAEVGANQTGNVLIDNALAVVDDTNLVVDKNNLAVVDKDNLVVVVDKSRLIVDSTSLDVIDNTNLVVDNTNLVVGKTNTMPDTTSLVIDNASLDVIKASLVANETNLVVIDDTTLVVDDTNLVENKEIGAKYNMADSKGAVTADSKNIVVVDSKSAVMVDSNEVIDNTKSVIIVNNNVVDRKSDVIDSKNSRGNKKGGKKSNKTPTKRVIITDAVYSVLPEIEDKKQTTPPALPVEAKQKRIAVLETKPTVLETKPNVDSSMPVATKKDESDSPATAVVDEKDKKSKKKKKKPVARTISASSSSTTLNNLDDSYDFLLDGTVLDDTVNRTNVEMSQELDRMIQKGMYNSLEEKIKSLEMGVLSEGFFKSVAFTAPTKPATFDTNGLIKATDFASIAFLNKKATSGYEDSRLGDSRFEDNRLDNSRLGDSRLSDSQLGNCQIDNSRVDNRLREDSQYEDSRLDNNQCEDSRLGFENNGLQDNQIDNSRLKKSQLEDSQLEDNHRNEEVGELQPQPSTSKMGAFLDEAPAPIKTAPIKPLCLDASEKKTEENKDANQLYPITQAVKEWMNKTRENTPEIELLKSPSTIYKEFCDSDAETETELSSEDSQKNGIANPPLAAEMKTSERVEDCEEITLFTTTDALRLQHDEEPDLLECWDNEISSSVTKEETEETSTFSMPEGHIEKGEDVLEVYESKYGQNEDYLKLRAEVEEKVKKPYPKHGNLPYRAICCSIM